MAPRKPKGMKVLGVKTRELPVKLTPAELADRAQRLAQVEGKLRDYGAETKEINSQRKGVREQLENELRTLGLVVRSKQEYRPVDIRCEARFAEGKAFFIREDTDEMIESRPLTAAEKQEALFEPGGDVLPFGKGKKPEPEAP